MAIYIVKFLTYFNTKEGIFGFDISNMISGKWLKPVLAIFKDLHIFLLAATLKSFGTSVPPGFDITQKARPDYS